MYIKQISIKNYRNFKNFETTLKPFTVIIGENNCGKSNLLSSLALIFNQDITYFKHRNLELDDFNYDCIQKFKNNVAIVAKSIDTIEFPEIKIDVVMTDFDEDQEAVVGDWFIDTDLNEAKLTYHFRLKNGFNKVDWLHNQREVLNGISQRSDETLDEFKNRKTSNVDFPITKYEYVIFGGGDQTKKVDMYFLRMLKMEILDALRDSKKELSAGRDYRLLFKILNNRDDSSYADIKSSLTDLSCIIDKNGELSRIKDEIKIYLDKVSLSTSDIDNLINFQLSPLECSEILKPLCANISETRS